MHKNEDQKLWKATHTGREKEGRPDDLSGTVGYCVDFVPSALFGDGVS